MTALAADRLVATRPVTRLNMPVKAASLIYNGALVFNDAGTARGGVPTAITPVLGIADNHYDNTGGGNGTINANIAVGGAAALQNGAGADALTLAQVGAPVFAIDDQTVGATSGGGTRPIAGTLVFIDAQGMCWVKTDLPPLPFAVQGLAAGLKIAAGQHVSVAASDTIATGLATVLASFAVLDDAPVIGCDRAQASIGNQAGAPAAGSILLGTFCPTSNANPTPVAATTFGKKVNWLAIGF